MHCVTHAVSVQLQELNVSTTDRDWIEATDRYFLEMLSQYNATAIFVGTERGDFTGTCSAILFFLCKCSLLQV